MKNPKSIPFLLWLAIGGMGIFACLHLILGFFKPLQFIAFFVNVILLIGLYKAEKWSYIVTIILSVIVPITVLFIEKGTAIYILILNSIVLIPLLLSSKFFFPVTKK